MTQKRENVTYIIKAPFQSVHRLLTHRFKPSFFNVAKPVSTINVLYSRSLSSAGPVQAQQPPKVLITGNAKWQIKQKVLILQKISFAYRHERPSESQALAYLFHTFLKSDLKPDCVS